MNLNELLRLGSANVVKVKAIVCDCEVELNIKKKSVADDIAELSKTIELGLLDKNGVSTGNVTGFRELQAYRIARHLVDDSGATFITEQDAFNQSVEWIDNIHNAIEQNYTPKRTNAEEAAKN